MVHEHRRSYRYPVAGERQRATLQVGGERLSVLVLDESAGGFAVAAAGRWEITDGQLLEMAGSAGRFRVRVVHCEYAAGRTTLGLQRVEDLPDPEQLKNVPRTWFGRIRLKHRRPLGGFPVGVPLTLLIMCAAALAWTALPQVLSIPLPGDGGRAPRRLPAPVRAAAKADPERGKTIFGLPANRPAGNTAAARSVEAAAVEKLNQLFSLSSEETARRLRLSPQQQGEVDRILNGSTQDLAAAFAELASDPQRWAERSREIVQQATDRVQAVLTEQQQRQWRAAADGS